MNLPKPLFLKARIAAGLFVVLNSETTGARNARKRRKVSSSAVVMPP
jgi:hypothetical protein